MADVCFAIETWEDEKQSIVLEVRRFHPRFANSELFGVLICSIANSRLPWNIVLIRSGVFRHVPSLECTSDSALPQCDGILHR